ncbi:ABC transporter ATP-binding protein [Rhizohabitans arisaemae]|uniref:ABC transporter ATP-binding protein n=1 Tax=Rhizohabitans arisaemae TaxID=2720610 RepID=UPI0024B09AEC|nr:ABC transporter ATP-binding protein [Rhizohabitans arisaemae]
MSADTVRLSVTNVTAGYGKLQVVNGISLSVGRGEALALLGPNGHGKTTLLRAITGLGPLTGGTVELDGERIDRLGTPAIVERGLMHVPQGCTLFPRLTVGESLNLAGRLKRARRVRSANLELVLGLFPKLVERRGQPVGAMSGGERQMLAIAMGIMANPSVLILDEPTLGLAPKVRHEILRTLLDIRATGLSLLVADGDVDFLFGLADTWCVVELGRTVGRGTTEEKPTQEQMMAMFVGGAHAPTALAAGPDEEDGHA